MFVKSQYGIVRSVAVHPGRAQVSRGSAEGIALLTLFCQTGPRSAANAVRHPVHRNVCDAHGHARELCTEMGTFFISEQPVATDAPGVGNEECPHFRSPTASLFSSRIAISASNCERFDVPALRRLTSLRRMSCASVAKTLLRRAALHLGSRWHSPARSAQRRSPGRCSKTATTAVARAGRCQRGRTPPASKAPASRSTTARNALRRRR